MGDVGAATGGWWRFGKSRAVELGYRGRPEDEKKFYQQSRWQASRPVGDRGLRAELTELTGLARFVELSDTDGVYSVSVSYKMTPLSARCVGCDRYDTVILHLYTELELLPRSLSLRRN